jgi:GDP-4-dehydro-6-deoxy-D-mannose reductase
MLRRVAITGGGGFVGQWLARALLARGDDVWLSGTGGRPATPAILSSGEWARAHWVAADVRAQADMAALVGASRPDLVVHLAGISFVPEAEGAPELARSVNVMGVSHLLSAVADSRRNTGVDPVIIVVGSGTQYGTHDPSEMPLPETAEQRPANIYAETKVAQERLALEMAEESGLRVICTRSFSHSGLGHHPRFFIPAIVERIKSQGRTRGNIAIGNDVIRDYTHIDDVVSAYLMLAERGRPRTVYNVASGTGVSTREIAVAAMRLAGSSGAVVSEPQLQRAMDMPVLIGSPERLERDTGWRPKRTYLDILVDLLAQA